MPAAPWRRPPGQLHLLASGPARRARQDAQDFWLTYSRSAGLGLLTTTLTRHKDRDSALRSSGLANHQDPVTPCHLPGGKSESGPLPRQRNSAAD
jgi:hypothetical protein